MRDEHENEPLQEKTRKADCRDKGLRVRRRSERDAELPCVSLFFAGLRLRLPGLDARLGGRAIMSVSRERRILYDLTVHAELEARCTNELVPEAPSYGQRFFRWPKLFRNLLCLDTSHLRNFFLDWLEQFRGRAADLPTCLLGRRQGATLKQMQLE